MIISRAQGPKKWYKKLGCGIGLFIIIILILAAVAFSVRVWQISRGIKSGEIPVNKSSLSNESITTIPNARIILETDDDPQVGPKDAALTIVEFFSFECPFCREAYPTIRELTSIYGDRVRFIFRDFGISEIAQKAAEAGECADDQKRFWPFHDKLFQNQTNLSVENIKLYAVQVGLDETKFNQCLDSEQYKSEVLQDFADARVLGVEGTPTWFINGRKVAGVIPLAAFKEIIDKLLQVTSN